MSSADAFQLTEQGAGLPDLKPPAFIVLGLIRGLETASPYDLKQEATRVIGGFWSLAHSQLYTETERLSQLGLLSEKRELRGRRRRLYSLTDRGHEVYDAWLRDADDFIYEVRDVGLLKLVLGAPPRELAQAQLEHHQGIMEGYRALEASLPESDRESGRGVVLQSGIGHEHEYLRFWQDVLNRMGSPAADA